MFIGVKSKNNHISDGDNNKLIWANQRDNNKPLMLRNAKIIEKKKKTFENLDRKHKWNYFSLSFWPERIPIKFNLRKWFQFCEQQFQIVFKRPNKIFKNKANGDFATLKQATIEAENI